MDFTNKELILSLLALLNPFIIGLIYLNYKPRASLQQSISDGITVCIGSTAIMLVIISIGTSILSALSVDLLSIKVAGGIILTLSVYGLMTAPADSETSGMDPSASIVSPFVTPICVGGASISLLFTYISAIPSRSLGVIVNLGSAVFITFFIIGLFLPISILCFKKVPAGILSVVKSLSLFIVFSIGINILISTIPQVLKA